MYNRHAVRIESLDGTYCYTRVATPVTYDDAKASCIQMNENATLPLVNSPEDLVSWSDLTSNRFVILIFSHFSGSIPTYNL